MAYRNTNHAYTNSEGTRDDFDKRVRSGREKSEAEQATPYTKVTKQASALDAEKTALEEKKNTYIKAVEERKQQEKRMRMYQSFLEEDAEAYKATSNSKVLERMKKTQSRLETVKTSFTNAAKKNKNALTEYDAEVRRYNSVLSEYQKAHNSWVKGIRSSEEIERDLKTAQNALKLSEEQFKGDDALYEEYGEDAKNKYKEWIESGKTETDILKLDPYKYGDQQVWVYHVHDLLKNQREKVDSLKTEYRMSYVIKPDFEEESKYVKTSNGKEAKKESAMGHGEFYTETGFDDIIYDYINKNPDAVRIMNEIDGDFAEYFDMDRKHLLQMTETDVAIFNYKWKNEGRDAALNYVEGLEGELKQEELYQKNKEWEKYGQEHKFLGPVRQFATLPGKIVAGVMNTTNRIFTGEINEYAGYNDPVHKSAALGRGVTKDMTPVGSFMYNTGMGILDFAATYAISKGIGKLTTTASGGAAITKEAMRETTARITRTLMSSRTMAETSVNAKLRGLSDDQAFALGVVSAATEAITEKYSIEALFDDGLKGWGYIGKNALAEASEEAASNTINFIADILVSRSKSEWSQAIKYYQKEENYSYSEAVGKAFGDQLLSMGLDALGGAISGSVISGLLTIINSAANRSKRKAAKESAENAEVFNSVRDNIAKQAEERARQETVDTPTAQPMGQQTPFSGQAAGEDASEAGAQKTMQRGVPLRTAEQVMRGETVMGQTAADMFRQGSTVQAKNTTKNAEYTPEEMARMLRAEKAETEIERTGIIYGVTEENIQSAKRIASTISREIVFYKRRQTADGFLAEDPPEIGGYYNSGDGKIYINANAKEPIARIIAHEMTHSVELADSYNVLFGSILKQIQRSGGNLNSMVADTFARYQEHGETLDNNGAKREIVAEYVAEKLLTDEKSITDFAQADQKSANLIMRFVDSLLSKFGTAKTKERAFLRRTRRLYAEALLETTSERNRQVWRGNMRKQLAQLDSDFEAGKISEIEYERHRDTLEKEISMAGEEYSAEALQYSISDKEKLAENGNAWYNKRKSVKLSKLEYARVSSAITQKNAGRQEGELPEVDYVYAADNFYVYANRAIGEFSILQKFDTETEREKITAITRWNKNEDYRNAAELTSAFKGKGQDEGRSSTRHNVNAGDGGAYARNGSVLDGKSERNTVGRSEKGYGNQSADHRSGRVEDRKQFSIAKNTDGEEALRQEYDARVTADTYLSDLAAKRDAGEIDGAEFKKRYNDYVGTNPELMELEAKIMRAARDKARFKKESAKAAEDNTDTKHQDTRKAEKEIFSAPENEIENFSQQIDRWLSGKMNVDEMLALGRTPEVLKQLGVWDVPIVARQEAMYKATGGKHSISIDTIRALPNAIADPIMIFKSDTVKKALVILTELTDQRGKNIVAAMHFNRYENRLQVNRIASFYGKDNIKNFVEEQTRKGNLQYIDKNRASNWSTSVGLQLPVLVQSIAYSNNSILQKENVVNRYNIKKSQKYAQGGADNPQESEKPEKLQFSIGGTATLEKTEATGDAEVKPEEQKKKESPEEMKDVHRNITAARRRMDAVRNKAKLSDTDHAVVGQLLRGELTPNEIPGESNAEGIMTVYEAKREYESYVRCMQEADMPEAVQKAYDKIPKTQRKLEKAKRKHKLSTDDTMHVGRLLRGEIRPEYLPEDSDIKGIMAVYEAKWEYEMYAKEIRDWKHGNAEAMRAEIHKDLSGLHAWRDKKWGLGYSTETMERNFRFVMGDDADSMIAKYITTVHKAAAASNVLKNEMRDRVRALNLSRKVEKGNLVSESHAVQLKGEAEDNIRILEQMYDTTIKRDGKTLQEWKNVLKKLAAENQKMDWKKVDEAIKEFHDIYDTLFRMMNETRVRNGYEPVNYRSGYFPHFQPGEEGVLQHFAKALGIDVSVDALPTSINGMTHMFKPGIQWFGNAQQRLGFNTVYDAVEGFDKYIEGVADVIYQTDNIKRLRALTNEIRYLSTEKGIQEQADEIRGRDNLQDKEKEELIQSILEKGKTKLSNFAVELDEYTNLLANKKSHSDRAMEQKFGRAAYDVMRKVNSNVAGSMVSLNITSWITNFIPLTQAWGLVDTRYMARGMWEAFCHHKTPDDIVARSTFLTNRRGSDVLVEMWQRGVQDKNALQKFGQGWSATIHKLSNGMEHIDTFVSDSIVRARYKQNLDAGMSELAAMDDADAFAASVIADRSKGAMPTIFYQTNPITKMFTQFQLEVKNQFGYFFKDVPREAREKGFIVLAAAFTKILFGAWLFNEIFEKFFGRRPALDPIDMAISLFGDTFGFEMPNIFDMAGDAIRGEEISLKAEDEGNLGTATSNLAAGIGEELPFVSGVLPLVLGETFEGGRYPIASALPNLSKIWTEVTDKDRPLNRKGVTVAKELGKPLVYGVLPGGGQVKKMVEGIAAAIQGGSYSVDSQGRDILQYPVYNDTPGQAIGNALWSSLFGKNTLPTARDWVKNDFDSLGWKETAAYQGMQKMGVPGKDAYVLLDELHGATKAADERKILQESTVSGTGKSVVYYGLMASEGERETMDAAEALGADMGAVTEALIRMKDAGELKGAEASNAKRDAIRESGISDAAKKMLYRDRISDSRDDDIAAFEDAGLSFDDFLQAQNEYATINETVTGATEKATAFSRWINKQGYSAKEKKTIQEAFKFYSQIPAEAVRYDNFVNAGFSDEKAYKLTEKLNALEPEEGKEQVSSLQKQKAIVDAGLSEKEQVKAFGQIMEESEYKRFTVGYENGVTPVAYVAFKEILPRFDADKNGNYKQDEVTKALSAMGNGGYVLPKADGINRNLTNAQKAALWQMANKSWKPGKNPFNVSVGTKVYNALNAE